jgi:hypothetical protein
VRLGSGRRERRLDHLEDLRMARGRVHSFRMGIDADELPEPARTSRALAQIEQDLSRLITKLEKAWGGGSRW